MLNKSKYIPKVIFKQIPLDLETEMFTTLKNKDEKYN